MTTANTTAGTSWSSRTATITAAALLVGAFGTGSVLAGFLQGFVVFLAIPVEWSAPFGGLPIIGAVSALALWLLHVVVLVGFRSTVVLDEVFARPDR